MTKAEFIEAASLSGYSSKATARAYCKENPKEEYTTSDFIAVYHLSATNRFSGGKMRRALSATGTAARSITGYTTAGCGKHHAG